MGIGRRGGGVGAVRFALDAGAEVRVTDRADPGAFAGLVAELEGQRVGFTLGRHDPADFEWADVVIRNPDVRPDSEYLARAAAHGARVEMEMTLFLRACPAPTIGVTGTKGKTTTTMLVHAMLRERWPSTVVAGNMGRSALARLGDVEPGVPAALELSSFQLEGLGAHRLSPDVAVITNLHPDHLDRYPSLDAYANAKANIARYQQPDAWTVFPADDERVAPLVAETPARAVTFADAPHPGERVLFVADRRLIARWEGAELDLGPADALRVPGGHSRRNALAAGGAALAVGVRPEEIRRGIAGFSGVAHRLEPVATVGEVDFVNDTTATTPEAAVAALGAFAGRPVVAIVGGSEKDLDLTPLADALARHAEAVVLLAGTATARLQAALGGRVPVTGPYDSMAAAVAGAAARALVGAVVLLAPGCASFGLFVDEFDRGEQFRAAVRAVATARAS
jgi:UDP-N-acetylmuramoylalanine--D-glutamate ligase